MELFPNAEETKKNKAIIDATEKAETLITIDPRFQPTEEAVKAPDIAPISYINFLGLWSLFLVVQAVMFWLQRRQKQQPKSRRKKQSKIQE